MVEEMEDVLWLDGIVQRIAVQRIAVQFSDAPLAVVDLVPQISCQDRFLKVPKIVTLQDSVVSDTAEPVLVQDRLFVAVLWTLLFDGLG